MILVEKGFINVFQVIFVLRVLSYVRRKFSLLHAVEIIKSDVVSYIHKNSKFDIIMAIIV